MYASFYTMLEDGYKFLRNFWNKTALNTSMFVSRHRVSMQVEKKLRIDEGVMLLKSKKIHK